ncbi:MFS transporter [Labrenzia sp. OB1]|uniref:MFS transporter n=1 Tax=Labrenzia sp. OB1 TaxID=1561204 RepID=UPI0007B24A81|nr:MFS transporter [Labrenzia sp. OB1]KZM50055.1 MFS transporter [Labrenzia sp. OB1]
MSSALPSERALKWRSLRLLMLAEISAMSLWFMSAAVLPDLTREFGISPFRQAALSSSVQIGFVAGALVSAFLGLADRIDPRRFFAFCAILAGLFNASLLVVEPGGAASILARFATGALLAGVYPVGMKIVVGWGQKDRGFLVGMLVGALTFGSAGPHLLALLGGTDWRWSLTVASIASAAGGVLCLLTDLGPYHARAARMQVRAILTAWTNPKIRYAYAGYLGHMWELYAMWAWIGVALAVSFSAHMGQEAAISLSRLIAFLSIAAGGAACIAAGLAADRIGKANIAVLAMAVSGTAAIASALTFGGPVWLTIVCVLVWGAAILPDSAQFSALVADYAPADQAGSLMTFQTALGFALTFFTVQLTPLGVDLIGWPGVFALMAIGPVFGIWGMVRLKRLG